MVTWKIMPTSCHCGGRFAWVKLRESGVYEMWGCVCHNLPDLKPSDTVECS